MDGSQFFLAVRFGPGPPLDGQIGICSNNLGLGFLRLAQAIAESLVVEGTLATPSGKPAQLEDRQLPTGAVKWFNEEKGYGFIIPDDGGNDIFVHHSNITMDGFRTLAEGQKVEYEVGEGRKGPEAVNVSKAD